MLARGLPEEALVVTALGSARRSLDPVLTKHRFMAAIRAPRYVPTMFGGGRLESG
jgi:hypothetical protein